MITICKVKCKSTFTKINRNLISLEVIDKAEFRENLIYIIQIYDKLNSIKIIDDNSTWININENLFYKYFDYVDNTAFCIPDKFTIQNTLIQLIFKIKRKLKYR